jgi:hypothetical protein
MGLSPETVGGYCGNARFSPAKRSRETKEIFVKLALSGIFDLR